VAVGQACEKEEGVEEEKAFLASSFSLVDDAFSLFFVARTRLFPSGKGLHSGSAVTQTVKTPLEKAEGGREGALRGERVFCRLA